jgi:hypothetical protein
MPHPFSVHLNRRSALAAASAALAASTFPFMAKAAVNSQKVALMENPTIKYQSLHLRSSPSLSPDWRKK